jgi:hypothetical protein
MSADGINKVWLPGAGRSAFREQLRSDPLAALAALPPTDAGRPALLAGGVASLHRMGGLAFPLTSTSTLSCGRCERHSSR